MEKEVKGDGFVVKMYNNIYVAVDFSNQSKIAFARGVAVAKLSKGTLHLVCVIDTHSFGSVEAYDLKHADMLYAKAVKEIEALKAEAEAAGVENVHVIVEKGSPKVILTSFTDADLVICGATGLNRAERFLLGSVSENVVRNAGCDVLVVR